MVKLVGFLLETFDRGVSSTVLGNPPAFHQSSNLSKHPPPPLCPRANATTVYLNINFCHIIEFYPCSKKMFVCFSIRWSRDLISNDSITGVKF